MKIWLRSMMLASASLLLLAGCQQADADEEEKAESAEEVSAEEVEDASGSEDNGVSKDKEGPTLVEDKVGRMNENLADHEFLEYYLEATGGAHAAVTKHYHQLDAAIQEYQETGEVSSETRLAYQEAVEEVDLWNERILSYDGMMSPKYEQPYQAMKEQTVKSWGNTRWTLREYEGFMDEFSDEDLIRAAYGHAQYQQSTYARNHAFFLSENGEDTSNVEHIGPSFLDHSASPEYVESAYKELVNHMLPLFQDHQETLRLLYINFEKAGFSVAVNGQVDSNMEYIVNAVSQRCKMMTGLTRNYTGRVAPDDIALYDEMTGDLLDDINGTCSLAVSHIDLDMMTGDAYKEQLNLMTEQRDRVDEVVSFLTERYNQLASE